MIYKDWSRLLLGLATSFCNFQWLSWADLVKTMSFRRTSSKGPGVTSVCFLVASLSFWRKILGGSLSLWKCPSANNNREVWSPLSLYPQKNDKVLSLPMTMGVSRWITERDHLDSCGTWSYESSLWAIILITSRYCSLLCRLRSDQKWAWNFSRPCHKGCLGLENLYILVQDSQWN